MLDLENVNAYYTDTDVVLTVWDWLERHGVTTGDREKGGDLGRMAALDAGYDVRSSGMTLDQWRAKQGH